MSKPRPALSDGKLQARSKVSNGARLLMADGRSPWSRRYCDLVARHVSDLGGLDMLNQAEVRGGRMINIVQACRDPFLFEPAFLRQGLSPSSWAAWMTALRAPSPRRCA